MGAFDDIESPSPTRYTSMLGRGMGEARRRIVLLIFLAFFLLLTVVAFRRQDTIKDVVNSSLHRTNTTVPVTKPDTTADTKADLKSDTKSGTTKTESQPSTKPEAPAKTDPKPDAISDTKSEKPKSPWSGSASGSKGPKLGNGDRVLAASSVADIHNSSLGVCCSQDYRTVEKMANKDSTQSLRRSSSSTCHREATNSMP